MELRQLRYLVALAEEGQFTRAAARVNVAQPALSQQIRKLEDELGLCLVDRAPHGAALTAAGEHVVARARTVLGEIDALRAEAGELKGLRAGRVAVGVTITAGPFDVAKALASFHRTAPLVELAVTEGLSTALAAGLRDAALDVALLSGIDARDRRGLDLRPIAREPLVAVLPVGHPLAGRRRIGMDDLRGEPFVSFRPGATIRSAVERAAAAAGFAPRVGFETGDVGRMRSLVAEGLAVAVLPRSDASRPGPPVAAVPFDDPGLMHEVFLAWRAGRRHAPAARALIEGLVPR